MSKKTFNPKDWASPASVPSIPIVPNTTPSTDIEVITKRIEATGTDIAPNYADWRDLGFALADALGESGRSYYHRLSCFYASYNQTETNKQFNNCLKAHGHGVTIKTLYHLAKQAAIDISTKIPSIPKVPQIAKYPNCQNGNLEILEISPKVLPVPKQEKSQNTQNEDLTETTEKTPTFPEIIYQNLPEFLQHATIKATSAEDKDLLLLGSLVAISPCLPNIYGIYAERKVFPNLFLFITASASAGKGRLTLCKELIYPIHRELIEQNRGAFEEYQRELNNYTLANKNDKREMERPQEPPLRMLIIPANNSATGLFQILNDNKGIGLLFETEGDTLAQTFKSEHGNYSDGFRKAFHHETISYNRRKDREYVELERPCLSALLSGTPKQVSALIPNAENGLFSRFIFYYMNILPVWKDVFTGDDSQTLDDYFRNLGNQFFDFYKSLQHLSEPLRFCLTKAQQQQFNAYFAETQNQYLCLCGVDYLATVRRLGLITFRITMILSTLRIMQTNRFKTPLVCSDTDFQTALEMVKILVQHAAKVFDALPAEQETPPTNNPRMALYQALPQQFDKQAYIAVATQLQIPESTANKWLTKFVSSNLLTKQAHGSYTKKTE
jgi:hypothetical protein